MDRPSRTDYSRRPRRTHSGMRIAREDLRWLTREARKQRRSLPDTLSVLLSELRELRAESKRQP